MSPNGPTMGLNRPDDPDHQLAIQNDIRAMRREINFGRRDSSVIGRCFYIAEHAGLSNEESMTLIAYNALCMLEQLARQQLNLSMLDLSRSPFLRKE